jgi:sugar/nucleoside kinase (ribokinase family)
MTVDLLTAGEVMVALRCEGLLRLGGTATVSIAGAEGNVAIAAARLGHRVAWTGRVGDDESGSLVLRTLAAEGVDTSSVRRDPDRETGLLLFEQRLTDLTRVEYHRRDSAGSRWNSDDLECALALQPRIVHVTGITAALSSAAATATAELMSEARRRGAVVSFDVNHRARLWSAGDASATLTRLAAAADIVIASPDELALVADDEQRLLDAGAREVVVKDGARGARVRTGGETIRAAAKRVRAVDSIGAGDAFSAGYLSGVLDGLPVAERLDRAVTLGAFAVGTRGDWEGLPTRDELDLLDAADGDALR